MPELNSEAIDFRVAAELFAPIRKLKRADFRALRLLARHQGRETPTVGGVLLFGRAEERREHFPDAWIQAGRFAGTDRRRLLDSTEIHSLPAQAVEEAVAFVRKYLAREAVIGEIRRHDRWTLPAAALREAIINAVVHADYSQRGAPLRLALFDDRLEIENPGLLPFGLGSGKNVMLVPLRRGATVELSRGFQTTGSARVDFASRPRRLNSGIADATRGRRRLSRR